jgi:hypothetical protein
MNSLTQLSSKIKIGFENLCLPVKIYLGITVFYLIYSLLFEFSINNILFIIILNGLWAILLQWICLKGYKIVSWILVVFPYLTILILMGFRFLNKPPIQNISEDISGSNQDISGQLSPHVKQSYYSQLLAHPDVPPQRPPRSMEDDIDIYSKQNRKYITY